MMSPVVFWWLILGVVSVFLMYKYRTDKEEQDFTLLFYILFGPLPMLYSLLLMFNSYRDLNKMNQFASITFVHFTTHSKVRIFLNEFLLVDLVGEPSMVKLVPLFKKFQNLTFLVTAADPVDNLGKLDITEVENAQN